MSSVLLKRPALSALILFVSVLFVVGLQTPRTASAAEGATSLYIPGGAGDILIAQSPKPGLQVANQVFVQNGNVSTAVLQGAVDIGLDLDVVLNFAAASYTFEKQILGATYTIGTIIPFGYAKLDATIGPFGVSGDTFNLADIAFVPVQLNWGVGNFHFKLAETIIAPTGDYDVSDIVNVGRNYWGFDTIGAVTWLDPEMGTEISVAPGIMFNTRNKATDYKTGAEFHLDVTANQFLSSTFAVGLRGYYYKQVKGDSGSGALLGSFKGESLGLGPGVVWIPAAAGGKLTILAKALFDVTATNRFDSNYYSIGAAWKF